MDWRKIRKIDAHIHLLPQEVHDANPEAEGEFAFARAEEHVRLMDRYNIERAVIMPFNDPCLMSMAFSVRAVHANMRGMCAAYPGRYAAFADVDTANPAALSRAEAEAALAESCFRGVKLHPENSGMNADSEYNDGIAEAAASRGVPLAVHSYPPGSREADSATPCAPARLGRLLGRHAGLKRIVCHLGGFQWRDALELDACFDISAVLPDWAARYGLRETNRILREFGADRLLFATDWPCSRSLPPDGIYESYFEILNAMDFTESEAERIACGNAERLIFGK
ncbi:MAG: amidohydrolase [Clostridia bacterium]|nr:amidohydrolase [Clostridia bacterium]